MKTYRKDSGERYTPFNHHNMTTQVIFNPDTGSKQANVTLSTIGPGIGSDDEVHEKSDQIFYVVQGEMTVMAEGKFIDKLNVGDALLVHAGDIHAIVNKSDKEDCTYVAITVPPLDQTH